MARLYPFGLPGPGDGPDGNRTRIYTPVPRLAPFHGTIRSRTGYQRNVFQTRPERQFHLMPRRGATSEDFNRRLHQVAFSVVPGRLGIRSLEPNVTRLAQGTSLTWRCPRKLELPGIEPGSEACSTDTSTSVVTVCAPSARLGQ